jgi:hypothetical protein
MASNLRKNDEGLIKIRPSEMPRIEVCPGSLGQSAEKPDVSDAITSLGRAFHDYMAKATDRGLNDVNAMEVAAEFGVQAAELGDLTRRVSFDPSGGLAEQWVEFRHGGFIVRGRIDWVGPSAAEPDDPGVVDLVDWKTGWRIDEDPEPWADPQTQTYGFALLESRPDVERVYAYKQYVRRGDNGWSAAFVIDGTNKEALRARLIGIIERAIEQAGKPESARSYVLSHHCTYCPGRMDCPGIRKEVTAALSATSEQAVIKADGKPGKRKKTIVAIDLSLDNVAKVHELVKRLRASANALDSQVKEFILAVGPVEVLNGRFLAVIPQWKRESMNFKSVMRAASHTLDDEQQSEFARMFGMVEDYFDAHKSESAKCDVFDVAALEDLD